MCPVTTQIVFIVGYEVCQVSLTREVVVFALWLTVSQGARAGLSAGVESKVF